MRAVVIAGPTASGKSSVSLEAADNNFEIISADSVQVYRLLDIGSGKLSIEDRSAVRHHIIDLVDPDYPFTAGDFRREAVSVCEVIISSGKIPMFVGGTGLYIDAFFKGLSDIPDIDPEIKNMMKERMSVEGSVLMYDELCRIDPVFSSGIHCNDRQRILRGLEVFYSTGKPISLYYSSVKGYGSDDTVYVGIHCGRETLRERINARVDTMMRAGFLEEVRALRTAGYGPELKSMRSIGYAEINSHIDGLISLSEAVELIKSNTVRYAKRQMTWFRKNKKMVWFEVEEIQKIKDHISKAINK